MKLYFIFILGMFIITIFSCSNVESKISSVGNTPFTFFDQDTQEMLSYVGSFHDEICLYILDTVSHDIDIFWNSNHYFIF